jgi:hypothetical protein
MLQLLLSLQWILERNRGMQLTESLTRTATHAKIQTSTLQANRLLQPSLDMCKSRVLEPRSCCGTCTLDFGDLMEPPQISALNPEAVQGDLLVSCHGPEEQELKR